MWTDLATTILMNLEWNFATNAAMKLTRDVITIPCLQRASIFSLAQFADWPWEVSDIRTIVFAAGMIVATVTDLRHGKIHNWLTVPLMVFALAIATFVEFEATAGLPSDQPTGGLAQAITGGLICFGLMYLFYVTAGGGGGDVKLATAVGFGFGAAAGLHVIALAYGLAWLADTTRRKFRIVTGWIKNSSEEERSTGLHRKREIRMAPWFLLAIVPVLSGILVP